MSGFRVAARAHHRLMGGIVLILLVVLYGLVCLMFLQPLWGLVLMIPIGVILAAIWLPVWLDHHQVEYVVDRRGVGLLKANKEYKRIEADRIKSVNHRGNTVVLRPKGLVGQPIFLHPASDAEAMVLAIKQSILNEECP
jgi:hypothetical protein